MTQVIVLLALVFSILIAVFAVQNTTAVGVSFLTFHSDSVAVSVLVLISAALGAAVMVLLGIWRELSIRWAHRAVQQQLKAAQKRVGELEAAQAVSTKPLAVSDAPTAAGTPADSPSPATNAARQPTANG